MSTVHTEGGTTQTLADAALAYVRRGWPILPLAPREKRPLTSNGFKSATTDAVTVARWWAAEPHANIGLVPGPAGFVVLDIDGPVGRSAAIELGLLSEPTLAVVTGREGGGLHLYYRHPGGRIANGAIGEQLDVRADDGYVVVPPSVHPSGAVYRWDPAEILELPPNALAAIRRTEGVRPSAVPVSVAIAEGNRNEALASIAGTLRRRGLDAPEILTTLEAVNARRCRPPLPPHELEAIARSIGRYAPGAPIGVGDNGWPPDHGKKEVGPGGRPVIVIREELNAVTDDAIAALVKTPQPVYVRSRMLVTVARDGTPQHRWLKRPPGSPVIVPLDGEHVEAMLDRAAVWARRGRNGLLPARPPAWVAPQVLRGRLEWPFPYLEAVTEIPTIRADGSVLDAPGWDEASGLLYEPMPGVALPVIPVEPSAEAVKGAVAALLDPVTEFPFVATSDRAGYVAAVLTLLTRHTIKGPCPLFAVRAPTPATGKGLLVSVVAQIGTGRPAPVSSLTDEAAEWRKLLLTIAMEGAPMVVLDNLTGAVGSNHLAAALTATEWMDRKLGGNNIVRAPLTTVWFLTGNNVSFKKTLGRRVVPIDLDAQVERPEDRRFKRDDLLGYVRAHRSELVAAGLTILRAYHVAGRPRHQAGPRMGSFEAWDDTIRGAVLWLGLDDPASTDEDKGRGRIRAQSDEDAEQHATLLAALESAFPGGPWFTAADVMARIEVADGGLTERREALALRDAVLSVVSTAKGSAISSKSLGPVLRDLRDRVCDGRVLRMRKRRGRHGSQWTVTRVGA